MFSLSVLLVTYTSDYYQHTKHACAVQLFGYTNYCIKLKINYYYFVCIQRNYININREVNNYSIGQNGPGVGL